MIGHGRALHRIASGPHSRHSFLASFLPSFLPGTFRSFLSASYRAISPAFISHRVDGDFASFGFSIRFIGTKGYFWVYCFDAFVMVMLPATNLFMMSGDECAR